MKKTVLYAVAVFFWVCSVAFLMHGCVANALDLKFVWEPGNTNETIDAYYLQEIKTITLEGIGGPDVQVTTIETIGMATNTFYVITNYQYAAPRTFTVIASNIVGVSDQAVPVKVPTTPLPPSGLKPVKLSFTLPLPGSAQLSEDLADWQESVTVEPAINNSVKLTFIKSPLGKLLFMRPREYVIPPEPLP